MPKGVKGFQKGIVTNPKGCPKGAHHIGRPKEKVKQECIGLATDAAPLIIARLIKHAIGEKTEQVVTENGVELPVPAPVPSQIKASEVVLSYVLQKEAERIEVNDERDRPSAEELMELKRRLSNDRAGTGLAPGQ